MQSSSKYKIYKQLKYLRIDNLPNRIFKFKRPGWEIIKKFNKQYRRKKKTTLQYVCPKWHSHKGWSYIKDKNMVFNNMKSKKDGFQLKHYNLKKIFTSSIKTI